MLKRLFSLLVLSISIFQQDIFAQNEYNIEVDLQHVEKDQVKVKVNAPKINSNEIIYQFARVIPGTYSDKSYGRFVKKVDAFDINGNKLKVKRLDKNQFQIFNATTLKYVEYWVNDTWDDKNKKNYIFQPGGTQIDANESFVINHTGFYGYFEGYKMLPYNVKITKPVGFYGASSLNIKSIDNQTDVYQSKDYVQLVDQPILYSKPDTISFIAGKSKISVAVYCKSSKIKSSEIAEMLKPLAGSLTKFFGGKLPVDHYNFIYFFPSHEQKDITKNGGYGALEHSYSSVYFLPEIANKAKLKEMILDVASHEFLHILTPLNVHSKEIADFNFATPKMSQHLWMYEGVTEYFSHIVQLRDSVKNVKAFLDEFRMKLIRSKKYPDTSFTNMSIHVVEPLYNDMYDNVYLKGALIGLLLDIRLLELSDGKQGLKELMQQLSTIYGPDKPFNDNELFDEIEKLSCKEIKQFFTNYVSGTQKLPIKEYFNKIGVIYEPEKPDSIYYFGNFGIEFKKDINKAIFTETAPNKNAFDVGNNYQIVSINGIEVTEENIHDITKLISEPENNNYVSLVYKYLGNNYSSKARPIKVSVKQLEFIDLDSNASPEQIKLRNKLFSGK